MRDANITFRKPQKVWFCYVKTFLFKITNILDTKYDYYSNILHQNALKSLPFKNQIRRQVDLKVFQTFFHPKYHKYISRSVINVYNIIVNQPTGQIYLLNQRVLNRKTYLFSFKLHNEIKLNATFNKINFFIGTQHCENAALAIKTNLNDNIGFFYCGYHSKFNFYADSNNVLMEFLVQYNLYLLPFEFNASLEVIDKDLITNIDTFINLSLSISTNLEHISQFHCYGVTDMVSVISYYFKTRKIYQITFSNLSLFSQKHYVYDGSGFTSPIITSLKDSIVTSTFQCILQFVIDTNTGIVDKKVFFVFKPQYLSKSNQIKIKEKDVKILNLSNVNYFQMFSTILVKAQYDFQVNLTIVKMFSSLLQNLECKEWGFLTLEYLDREYEESITLCSNHDHLVAPSRNFYSVNSSLIIFFYAYPGGPDVKISGILSTTKCKPIHFDPCIYYLLQQQCETVAHFKPYLSNVTKFVNISLISSDRTYYNEDVFFNVMGTECTIIQIGNKIPERIHEPHYGALNCMFSYATGCKTRISAFDKENTIVNVIGHLSEPEIEIIEKPKISVFYLDNNSKPFNSITYTSEKRNIHHQFYKATAVNINLALSSRMLNWFDILVERVRESRVSMQYIEHVTYLHIGLNRMPNLHESGLSSFSDADVLIKLSTLRLNRISLLTLLYHMPLKVKMVRSILFTYQQNLVAQGMCFNIVFIHVEPTNLRKYC